MRLESKVCVGFHCEVCGKTATWLQQFPNESTYWHPTCGEHWMTPKEDQRLITVSAAEILRAMEVWMPTDSRTDMIS